MKFKLLYSLWSGVPIVGGLFHIGSDVSRPYNKLFGLASTFGLAYLQIGLLNLLNAFYGSSIPGIRCAAVVINVLSIGLLVWMIRLFTNDNYNLFLLGIMATMALFSIFNTRAKVGGPLKIRVTARLKKILKIK
jgi:hypothetical protein